MPKSSCRNFQFQKFSQELLLVPWFVKKRKAFQIICFLRLIFFLVSFFTLCETLITEWEKGKYLVYFTHWTLIMQTIFQLSITVSSYRFLKLWPKTGQSYELFPFLPNPPKLRFCLLWVQWEMVFSTTILVSIFFWGLLYKKGTKVSYNMVEPHGGNCLFTFFEFFFNRAKFPCSHWWFVLPYGILYMVVYIIYYFMTEIAPYQIIDPSKFSGWVWFVFVWVLIFFLLLIGNFFAYLREKLLKPSNYQQLAQDEQQETEIEKQSDTDVELGIIQEDQDELYQQQGEEMLKDEENEQNEDDKAPTGSEEEKEEQLQKENDNENKDETEEL
ncbi:hypothetical protein M0813_27589 [Anaeramoeba flamelloides]|uniref:Transmembrane protein n=1 Tax=Anaeramoeba flamelloides TaxID=1746091 RepID=A0ABQ8XWV6_9EUKA|nr:hypothetical protein M0813_27589 [Anaeramoeba flamelloides]